MAEGPDVRILVFAPIGRDAPACAELLERAGLRAELCKSLPALLTEAQTGTAAILIAEEGLFGNDLAPLISLIEAQPAWSDLPIVVLTSHHEHAVLGAWRGALVSRLGNVSLLERPVQSITLTSTVQAAVRARLRQYEVRALLEAREEAAQKLESRSLRGRRHFRRRKQNSKRRWPRKRGSRRHYARPKRWKLSGNLQAASLMISTIC